MNRRGCWFCHHVLDVSKHPLICAHPTVVQKRGRVNVETARDCGEPCGPAGKLWAPRFHSDENPTPSAQADPAGSGDHQPSKQGGDQGSAKRQD